jgi:hypothetical protein
MKNMQAHIFRDLQVMTEAFARNKRAFINHGRNSLGQILGEGSTRPMVVAEIDSPFLEMMISLVDGAEGG